MKTPAYALFNNRQAERASARSAVEVAAARERARVQADKAREVLKDAILAAGIEAFTGTALLAAAESYTRAAVRVARIEAPSPPGPDLFAGRVGA